MELNELYAALEYGKYGEDLCNHEFQLYDGPNERFNGIWLSGLFSLLIKEAGRLCDNYASDMYHNLHMLHEDLYGDESVLFDQESYRAVVGIRDCGVDNIGYMLSRDGDSFTYRYREIFLITITPSEKYPDDMRKLSCYKVEPSSVDAFIKRKKNPYCI